jgi:serine/threonine-protein kinase
MKPVTTNRFALSTLLKRRKRLAPDDNPFDVEDPNGRRKSPIFKRRMLIIAIALTTAFAVIGGGIYTFLTTVDVADLKGWNLEDAQLWAETRQLYLRVEETYNDEVASGLVFSQQRKWRIKPGDFLGVSVSLGHDNTQKIPLPNFLDMTVEEVETWAEENYMSAVEVRAMYTSKAEEGLVLSYEIEDENAVTSVLRSTPINVYVAKNPAPSVDIEVPDFAEGERTAVQTFASRYNLTLNVEEEYDDHVPYGNVISQSVPGGEIVYKGDELNVVISKGKKIEIPDFSELTLAKAQSYLSDNGLKEASVVQRYSSKAKGNFVSQSISAGSLYDPTKNLQVVYSLGNKIAIGSFVSLTTVEAAEWATEYNVLGARITFKVTHTQGSASKGTIIHQDKVNTDIAYDQQVQIVVSDGGYVFVPNFVSPTHSAYSSVIMREEAVRLADENKMIAVFTASKNANYLPGEVWSQSISAGSEVEEGAKITLKYNPIERYRVPSLKGLTIDEIRNKGYLKMFLIQVENSDDYIEGYVGKVYSQSITAGSTLASGSVILVSVGSKE